MTTTATPWSNAQKTGFRFFFVLFLLYIFFNPNGVLPYSDYAFEFYIQPFQKLMAWLAKNSLHLSYPLTVFTNGSGDTTYDYVVVFFVTVLAATASAGWTLFDKRTKTHNKLLYWLCVVVRYYVAITMFSYGFAKVFKLQFPFLSPDRLLQPYGSSSPMGLAWNFFGFSKGYNYVMGVAELLSGGLLLFRRTATLGAAATLVVAGNIMAVNYCFDVPVKLLSTALVVMALFLLARDVRRLVDFFFLNKPAGAANIAAPAFRKKWQNVTAAVVKYGLILYVITANILQALDAVKAYGDDAAKPPLYGIYNVETFVRNGNAVPPLTTDTSRWNKLVVSYPGRAVVKFTNDTVKGFAFNADTVTKKIGMSGRGDTAKKASFVYSVPQKDILLLTGNINGDTVSITLKRYDPANFRLVNRGFHWINEYPYNR